MALVNVRRPSSLIDKDENPITCPESMCISSWAHTTSIDVNESYFTVRGAAVILSHSQQSSCTSNTRTEFLHEIEVHLHNMLGLLRPQDTLSMAVRLQNKNPEHARYLALVTCNDKIRESGLIGFDCVGDDVISIGLTVPFSASANVELDGDGGILVELSSAFYVFKPCSLQALWLVFQNLHKELRRLSTSLTGTPQYHNWLKFYQDSALATAEDALCSLWQTSLIDEAARDDLKANVVYTETRPIAELENESIIGGKLREIMQSSDLEEVTSRDIFKQLETECTTVELHPYKDYIDRTIMFILGQIEKPSRIFDYLYLGTEWNSVNFDELQKNNIKYILNVSKEIDNFFPSHFEYLKIFITDESTTNLINIWQRTFRFIKSAKEQNACVLVHCKKGISRSASIVTAYIMKEYKWSLNETLAFLKQRRPCILPNPGFTQQLQMFDGMLNASRKSTVFQKPAESNV